MITKLELRGRMGMSTRGDVSGNWLNQPATRNDLLEALRESAERIRTLVNDNAPDLTELPGEWNDNDDDPQNARHADGDCVVNDLAIFMRAWEDTRADLAGMDELIANEKIAKFLSVSYLSPGGRPVEAKDDTAEEVADRFEEVWRDFYSRDEDNPRQRTLRYFVLNEKADEVKAAFEAAGFVAEVFPIIVPTDYEQAMS